MSQELTNEQQSELDELEWLFGESLTKKINILKEEIKILKES